MAQITKSGGGVEEFNPAKLMSSLRHAGAEESVAQSIASDVEREITDGMSTHDVYARAFGRLRQHRATAAARYSLKRAVLEFGPSGFPFEAYLAEIFRSHGYEATIDVHVRGKCVEHEVDLVLRRHTDGVHERIYVEAKFHNTVGFKTDLQVALYVQARLMDILEGEGRPQDHDVSARHHGMVITNTKFTSLATQYARCRGLGLIGWDYPHEGNLHDLITESSLYPITALTSLSHRQKQGLLAERVVLCNALSRHEDALARVGVGHGQMRLVLDEASGLCMTRN
jgi:hypothetical protein